LFGGIRVWASYSFAEEGHLADGDHLVYSRYVVEDFPYSLVLDVLISDLRDVDLEYSSDVAVPECI